MPADVNMEDDSQRGPEQLNTSVCSPIHLAEPRRHVRVHSCSPPQTYSGLLSCTSCKHKRTVFERAEQSQEQINLFFYHFPLSSRPSPPAASPSSSSRFGTSSRSFLSKALSPACAILRHQSVVPAVGINPPTDRTAASLQPRRLPNRNNKTGCFHPAGAGSV